ncbi:hypothetical protein CCICO_02870 [Corynebacterium ciconiae DSM 44920]|nr:hypothetical protein CCICO_02870 [Corynebacterium ciconiae DSM 44920]
MALSCTDENEGRVAAACGVPGMALMPAGSTAGGFLFDSYGATPGMLMCVAVFIVSLTMVATSRHLRRLPRSAEMTRG